MMNDLELLASISSSFNYHLRVEFENPCLFDQDSLDCFLFKQFFINPPCENVFIQYLPLLKENSERVPFTIEYTFDPFKFAYDYYQSKYYAPLIMLVNNIPTILFFDPEYLQTDYLLCPTKGIVNKLWVSSTQS
jgi:hypothetical protein